MRERRERTFALSLRPGGSPGNLRVAFKLEGHCNEKYSPLDWIQSEMSHKPPIKVALAIRAIHHHTHNSPMYKKQNNKTQINPLVLSFSHTPDAKLFPRPNHNQHTLPLTRSAGAQLKPRRTGSASSSYAQSN